MSLTVISFIKNYIPATDAWKEFARKMTPKDVGDYLRSIKLDRYVKAFADDEVDGETLLDVVEKEDREFLDSLNVENAVHKRRIFTKFSGFCLTRSTN